MIKKENLKTRKSSELQVFIHIEDTPSDNKLEESKKYIIEKYDLNLKKFEIKKIQTETEIMKLTVSLETRKTTKDEPIVAALEAFLQILGNIRISKKILKYRRD